MTTKQQFNVTYVCPWNGRTVRAVEVSADRIYMADSGEMVFRYNHHYTACEVVEVEEVSQDYLAAKMHSLRVS
jgi:hypothetical protein